MSLFNAASEFASTPSSAVNSVDREEVRDDDPVIDFILGGTTEA